MLWLYRIDPALAFWNASGVFAVVVLLIGAPQDLQGYALQLSIEAFSVAATR